MPLRLFKGFGRRCAIAVFALLALAAQGAAAQAAAADGAFAQRFIPTRPPKPAPDIVFQDEKGASLSLKDFQGRYVLVNLWATWCGPCRQEIPSLSELQNRFVLQRFSVLAIAEDSSGLTAARDFYQRNDVRHLPLYADPSGRAPALAGAKGLPTSLLIDPGGMEIGRVEGKADWAAPDAVAFLEAKMTAYGNQ